MLNYNLMVLGFPTILRVRADASAETFRGNRTEQDIVNWIGQVTGVAPMDHNVHDEDWLGVPTGSLHVGDDVAEDQVNWPLLAANFVTLCNVAWLLWKGIAVLKRNVICKQTTPQDSQAEPARG